MHHRLHPQRAEKYEKTLLIWSQRSVKDAVTFLAQPDVVVTNQRVRPPLQKLPLLDEQVADAQRRARGVGAAEVADEPTKWRSKLWADPVVAQFRSILLESPEAVEKLDAWRPRREGGAAAQWRVGVHAIRAFDGIQPTSGAVPILRRNSIADPHTEAEREAKIRALIEEVENVLLNGFPSISLDLGSPNACVDELVKEMNDVRESQAKGEYDKGAVKLYVLHAEDAAPQVALIKLLLDSRSAVATSSRADFDSGMVELSSSLRREATSLRRESSGF